MYIYIFIHNNATILQLHNYNLKASWSTECRLTQREIFKFILVDVVILLKDKKSSYIYIKMHNIAISQFLIRTPPGRQNVD